MEPASRFRVHRLRSAKRQKDASNHTAPLANEGARPTLLSFEEMPEWFQRESNPSTHNAYRPISGSAQVSLSSWSYIHNESVNIHTHLISAIIFLIGEWYIQQYLTSKYAEIAQADLVAFSVFMLAAVTCFFLSATYHTLMNHSKHVEQLCLRLDMFGVVVFIVGDLVLEIYVVFWCQPLPRNIYWSLIGVFGTVAIFVALHRKCQGSKYRLFRASMFIAVGSCGIAPLIHGLKAFGLSVMMNKGLFYIVVKAACLLSGTLFYATRFPEVKYPGSFDLCGSHSIIHVLVVCATAAQVVGYLNALSFAQENLTCHSP